ncbi:hypothetical protein PVK06_000917 [Gossypium arboreum]|uniref:RNase H type-1 domain-containing protein n=1 Tax=Gossypium arboreum TaxID=29729 RepID=A0ABR0R0N4_GOSAR|nr:hypothetical protein PVK06_000917 [Gossypium arboreum]
MDFDEEMVAHKEDNSPIMFSEGLKCPRVHATISRVSGYEDSNETFGTFLNFSSCQFQFIAREGNKAAHAMTTEGLRADEDLLWVEDAPSKAMEAVDSDQRFSRPP